MKRKYGHERPQKRRREMRQRQIVPLAVDHGYLIATIGGVKVLVDNGAPVSFGGHEIVIRGQRHVLAFPLPFTSVEHIRELSGAEFDAVLGTDVLAKHPFILDTRRGELTFGQMPEGKGESVEMVMGTPCIPVVVEGEMVRCILDAGANIAFRRHGAHSPVPPDSRRTDFTVPAGFFEAGVWRRPVRVLGHDLKLDFSELPREFSDIFALTGADGIMGMELLNFGRLGIDLAQHRVVFEPFEDASAAAA